MFRGILAAAAAVLACAPAGAAVVYQTSGTLAPFEVSGAPIFYESFAGVPAAPPGSYTATLSFDRDVTLDSSSLIFWIFNYDIDCGDFTCGGSDGVLAFTFTQQDSRTATSHFTLRPAHREGDILWRADSLQSVYLRGDAGADFTLTFEAAPAPEPATWAMMIGGFGMAGAAFRQRRARPARGRAAL